MDFSELNQQHVVDIDFECENCESKIDVTIAAPLPNLSAETNEDSTVEDEDYIECEECGHIHEVIIYSSMYSISCSLIGNINKDINCSMPYYTIDETDELNWLIHNGEQSEILDSQLKIVEKIQNEVEYLSEPLQNSLNCMAYAHIVAATEGYLSSIFIHNVLNSKQLFNRLCLTDPELKSFQFSITSLIEDEDIIKKHVLDHLNKISFHNVAKIKKMFKAVLNHDFGDIGWFGKAVSIRHDCVHRAGMTKQGEPVSLENVEVLELIQNCKKLAIELQKTLSKIPIEEFESFDFN